MRDALPGPGDRTDRRVPPYWTAMARSTCGC